jgi:hypothetical protein
MQQRLQQLESLGLRRQEIAKADARARAGGGSAPSYQFREVEGGEILGFNPKNPTQQIRTGQKAPSKDPWAEYFPAATGAPLIIRK